jgi:hypothetical protein
MILTQSSAPSFAYKVRFAAKVQEPYHWSCFSPQVCNFFHDATLLQSVVQLFSRADFVEAQDPDRMDGFFRLTITLDRTASFPDFAARLKEAGILQALVDLRETYWRWTRLVHVDGPSEKWDVWWRLNSFVACIMLAGTLLEEPGCLQEAARIGLQRSLMRVWPPVRCTHSSYFRDDDIIELYVNVASCTLKVIRPLQNAAEGVGRDEYTEWLLKVFSWLGSLNKVVGRVPRTAASYQKCYAEVMQIAVSLVARGDEGGGRAQLRLAKWMQRAFLEVLTERGSRFFEGTFRRMWATSLGFLDEELQKREAGCAEPPEAVLPVEEEEDEVRMGPEALVALVSNETVVAADVVTAWVRSHSSRSLSTKSIF